MSKKCLIKQKRITITKLATLYVYPFDLVVYVKKVFALSQAIMKAIVILDIDIQPHSLTSYLVM